MNNEYWLYIEPYVYLEIKSESALLYNTLDHEFIIYDDPTIISLLKDLLSESSNGVILLDENLSNMKVVEKLIFDLKTKFLGDVIDVSLSTIKPIQLPPIPTVQYDIRNEGKVDDSILGDKILNYLNELTLYLDTYCDCKCPNCFGYNKQLLFCTQNTNSSYELSFTVLCKLVNELKACNNIQKINLVIQNIAFISKEWDQITSLIAPIKKNIFIYTYYLNYNTEVNIYNLFGDNVCLLIDYPLKLKIFEEIENLRKININFIVKNDFEYDFFLDVVKKYGITKYDIYPFYDGTNYDFFKRRIFLDKIDVVKGVSNIHQIYRNKKINNNYFGKLSISSSGDVFFNLAENTIGNLLVEDLKKILFDHFYYEDMPWFRIRRNKPCDCCLFQFLCPPPSNYELALSKNNLCTLF
jgi:pseudo-rSAM protein